MNIRIAISGKMASGKSLVAQRLVKHYGFMELAFATRLKVIASEMFGLDVGKKDERGRLILQQFAHRMREIDPLVWVRYVLKQIPLTGNVVVSDVRYPNEFNTLKGLGFVMVRMYMGRKCQERVVQNSYPDLPLILLDDYTERAIDDYTYDWVINNDEGVPLSLVYRQTAELIGRIEQYGR